MAVLSALQSAPVYRLVKTWSVSDIVLLLSVLVPSSSFIQILS